jgi:tight adherence protein B
MMKDMTWLLMLLALVSAVGVVYSLWWMGRDLVRPRGPNVSQRLSELQHARVQQTQWQLLKHRPLSHRPWLDRALQAWPALHRLDHYLQQTGWPVSVEQVLVTGLLSVVLPALLCGLLSASLWWALAVMVLAWSTGLTLLHTRRLRRRRQIEAQLPDALDLIARAMQAGHALSSAMLLAASEGPEPLASEWQSIFDQINFGIPSRVAIETFADRVGSDYVRLFVVSTLVQMETGGNMADILKNTAELIRQREQLRASVKVLSAEGRISALILSVLPFGLATLLALINPGFMAVLWIDPLGLKLLASALGLMTVGIVWMWRMIDIAV